MTTNDERFTGRVARRTATGIEVTPDGAAWPPPPFVERIDGSAPTTFRDENETRGIQVSTGSRIGYAHPSLGRDEVERLDRLRAEAGDRASAELVERAIFDGDADALAALGFHAVPSADEPPDPAADIVLRLPPSTRGYLVCRTATGLEVQPGDVHHGTLPAALDVGTADAVTLGAARVIADDYAAGLTRDRDEALRELQDLDLVLPVACGSRADAAMQMQADLASAEAQLAALREAARAYLTAPVGSGRHDEERGVLTAAVAAAEVAEAHDRRVRAEALREAADDPLMPSHAAWRLRARADEIERGS